MKFILVVCPSLRLTDFDRKSPGSHQSLDRDIAEYHISVSYRLGLAYEVVREQNVINAAEVAKANSVLGDLVHNRPVWKVGQWAWVYNDVKTITQGASSSKSSPDEVLKSKLCLNWTGP